MKKTLIACALGLALPSLAFPQALTSLLAPRRLQHAQSDSEADRASSKPQIDAVDVQIAEATRLGQTPRLRRLIAKGTTLLAGRAWTDALDYTTSVVIRTDHVVADSTRPYPVRLEQIYSPALELRAA